MIIRDENYFTDKYELTRTHSEVMEAVAMSIANVEPDCGGDG